MNLKILASNALRRAVEQRQGSAASPAVCQDIKREVIADLAKQGYPLWHVAHRIHVEFIDGQRPNLTMPQELLKPH